MKTISYPQLLFTLILFHLCACTKKESTHCDATESRAVQYEIIDSLNIKLPAEFKEDFYTIPMMQYWADETEEGFFILSNKERKIYKFNINTNELKSWFDLSMINEQISDFNVHQDEAYIVTLNPEKLYSIKAGNNPDAEVILNASKKEYISTFPFGGDHLNVLTHQGEKYIIANVFSNNNGGVSADIPVFARLNLQTRVIEDRFFDFPERQDEHFFPMTDQAAKLDLDSLTYIAEGHEHFIYKYNNLSGKLISKHCIRSKFIEEDLIEGLPNEGIENQQMFDYVVSEPYYLSLIYDKYSGKFFRLVKHRQQLLDGSGKLMPRYEGAWSVILLDKELNTEGEALLSGKDYLPYIMFPVKRGLLLAKKPVDEHPKGILQFHLIKYKI